MLDLRNKLTTALQGLDLENPAIDVHQLDRTIMATIVSGSFTGMGEAERQKRVWEVLLVALTAEEQVAVEFVFTFAPEEQEATEEAV